MTPRYSLVIPLYNEAGNLLPLLESILAVLTPLTNESLEIILIDDGSTDATPAEIAAAVTRWPVCRSLRHATNRGQADSLLHGLKEARGEILLTIDGDGQNDPKDFPVLLSAVESGTVDVACGWRVDRNDRWLRRVLSRVGNAVRRAVLGDRLHDGGCQLRAMRRAVVDVLFPVPFMQSFLPSIAHDAGLRVAEFPVRHHPRVRGQAHFGLRQLWWEPAAALLTVRRHMKRRRQTRSAC